ncbi:unnamed protein product [Diplocarpon coronariae]
MKVSFQVICLLKTLLSTPVSGFPPPHDEDRRPPLRFCRLGSRATSSQAHDVGGPRPRPPSGAGRLRFAAPKERMTLLPSRRGGSAVCSATLVLDGKSIPHLGEWRGAAGGPPRRFARRGQPTQESAWPRDPLAGKPTPSMLAADEISRVNAGPARAAYPPGRAAKHCSAIATCPPQTPRALHRATATATATAGGDGEGDGDDPRLSPMPRPPLALTSTVGVLTAMRRQNSPAQGCI